MLFIIRAHFLLAKPGFPLQFLENAEGVPPAVAFGISNKQIRKADLRPILCAEEAPASAAALSACRM
jgi:hypothetical protein